MFIIQQNFKYFNIFLTVRRLFFCGRRTRKKIRHSETNYLSVVLNNHNFEDLMRRAKSLSDNAREVLPEVEKSQLQLEQGLRELRNKG